MSSLSKTTSVKTASNGRRNSKWYKSAFQEDIELKKGKFTKAESQTIRKTIEDFCKTKGVSPERLCSSTDDRKDPLRGSWYEIARCLPNRTVQAVYRHGLRQLHPFKRGMWTEEETNELQLLVLRHGKRWALIQNKLHRSADACRDKHREFNLPYAKGKWSEEESEKLIKIIRSLLKLGPDVSLDYMKDLVLKNRRNNVPWEVVSKKMKNRSRLACFKRFQQMTGIKQDLVREWRKRRREELTEENGDFDLPQDKAISSKRPKVNSEEESDDSDDDLSSLSSLEEESDDSEESDDDVASAISARTAEENTLTKSTIGITSTSVSTASDDAGYDLNLLQTLANSSYNREADVVWSSIRYPNCSSEARWQEILDEYIETHDNVDEDELLDMPVCEVAKILLENQWQVVI